MTPPIYAVEMYPFELKFNIDMINTCDVRMFILITL